MSAAKDYFSQLNYLVIEANSSCNLACSYCNRKELEKQGLRKPKNLSLAEFENVLSMFRDTKIDTIKFEGLSEPMLHPEFHILSRSLRREFPKAFIIIATNLQYNLPKTSFLETLPFVDMVYLSIDGVGETYEAARPGAKFEKLLKSLEHIKALVPAEIRATKLHINFTLSPQNYQTLPEIYKLKENYGLASVRINLAQNWSEDQRNVLTFSQEILDFLEPYRRDLKGVGGWDFKDCFWPFSGIVVDVFGDVRQCLLNTSQKPIGNIYEQPVRDIYNQAFHYQQARSLLSQNKAPAACSNCDYKNLSATLKKILRDDLNPKPREKVVL